MVFQYKNHEDGTWTREVLVHLLRFSSSASSIPYQAGSLAATAIALSSSSTFQTWRKFSAVANKSFNYKTQIYGSSILVPIFKHKGDIQSCKISVTLNWWVTWWSHGKEWLNAHLRTLLVSDNQLGCMPSSSITNPIFLLRRLLEINRESQKAGPHHIYDSAPN